MVDEARPRRNEIGLGARTSRLRPELSELYTDSTGFRKPGWNQQATPEINGDRSTGLGPEARN